MERILVVEDDPTLRSNICEILDSEGFQSISAVNGKDGLQKAVEHVPDLIISDVMMPVLDGFELIKELSNNEITASIPVILLTAKIEPEDIRRGMSLGADDYLLKPFRIDDLVNSVKARLQKKKKIELKIEKMKNDISEKLPHELRTPLVPILGFSELIENESDLTSIREMARMISKSGGILRDKIEKFLYLKDLILIDKSHQSQKANKNFSNVDEFFLLNIIHSFQNDLSARQRIKIKQIESSFISVSEVEIKVLIKELLENALKFSPLGKPVEITSVSKNDQYELTVCDYGRGLNENEINSIHAFKKFGKDSFRECGLGLGLEIVKRIVNKNNGNLSVISTNGSTVFTVSLPLVK